MAKYRILAMDGGGIRGLITAILLERLEAVHPGFLSSFDLFAGTSTGGLLALGLAAGKTPTEARRLYEVRGPAVFSDSWLDDLKDLGKIRGAEYRLEPLMEALMELFGDQRLSELPKNVLVSAFDLDAEEKHPDYPGGRSWKAKFFHNYPGADSDGDERVADVGLYTALAPSYFPVYNGFIDGGVVAGNPSVCALAQAIHPGTGSRKLEDIILLSVGTGHNPRYLNVCEADWGLAQWAPHLVSIMLEGGAGLAHYQCRQFLGRRYFRINPRLPEAVGMDAIDKIPLMQRIASECNLDSALDWVERFFPVELGSREANRAAD